VWEANQDIGPFHLKRMARDYWIYTAQVRIHHSSQNMYGFSRFVLEKFDAIYLKILTSRVSILIFGKNVVENTFMHANYPFYAHIRCKKNKTATMVATYLHLLFFFIFLLLNNIGMRKTIKN
jgi:hypothetical protein